MFDNFVKGGYRSCSIIIPAGGGRGCLLIGDFNSATDAEGIKNNNIKTIITAATNMDHLLIDKSIKHIVYPLLDAKTQAISSFFQRNYETIQQNLRKGGVLVHCAAGISRSATLVIAYLMKKNSWGFKQAISFVRKSRPEVCPNLGFQMQLKKYEKQINKKAQDRLSKTMIPSMNNLTSTSFNSFITKQQSQLFPNIVPASRGQNRIKLNIKSRRPYSKDQYNVHSFDQNFMNKGLLITSYGNKFKHGQHDSSLHRNIKNRPVSMNKKIAALMFHNKLSKSSTPGDLLRRSDIRLTPFR